MLILKMDEGKHLTITKDGFTFEGENNAEKISVILPKFINGHDLKECIVDLNIAHQDNIGDIVEITPLLKEFNGEFYSCEVDITNKVTFQAGNVQLWIKIINSASEMIAKSNPVKYTIRLHIDIDEIIPEQQLSLLDEWEIRMDTMLKQIQEIESSLTKITDHLEKEVYSLQEYIEPLKQGVVLLAKRVE